MVSKETGHPSPTAAIAVFGSSEPRSGEAAYETARQLGQQLAQAAFLVVTGGYAGVMEAASRGARERGGRTLGVVCASFGDREPNPYLTEVIRTEDLHGRTRELIERASGYVVLPGKAGTLAELAWLWALDRAGCLARRPVVLLGDLWSPLLELLERTGMLEPSQIRRTRLARTPEEAVGLLEEALHRSGERGA